MQVFQTDGPPPSSGSSILAIIGWSQNNNPALSNNVTENNAVMPGNSHRVEGPGTITLLAERQFAVVINASLARSTGNRCVTIEAKGNCACVVRRNSNAALRWRGSIDHEPNISRCLRV